MKIKNRKYKHTITITSIIFILVLLFEVIPNYWKLSETLYSLVSEKLTKTNAEDLEAELNSLKRNHIQLKKMLYGEFNSVSDKDNYLNALEKFNIEDSKFRVSFNSIKPIKKIKKGRLNFQRFSLEFSCDYENVYNYCRWLEYKNLAMNFEEIVISKQKDSENLQISGTVDVLIAGGIDE
ncbi:MAG: hypothetical protein IPM56_03200 [Ignavibacteriales bacterium]|nr:MAG: hypothetical protein IPM56_03200 [Ignavibacteriales bacterium]